MEKIERADQMAETSDGASSPLHQDGERSRRAPTDELGEQRGRPVSWFWMTTILLTAAALSLIAIGWLYGWFAAPLQGHGNRWGMASVTESEETHLIAWFIPRPSTQITLTDAWLDGADDLELVAVHAVLTSDEHPQIGSMPADDPERDRYVFRELAGTVVGPTAAGEPNDFYVVFEVRWAPKSDSDFVVAGPMRLSYRSGLRRLEYRECGFISYGTSRTEEAADEASDSASRACTES